MQRRVSRSRASSGRAHGRARGELTTELGAHRSGESDARRGGESERRDGARRGLGRGRTWPTLRTLRDSAW